MRNSSAEEGIDPTHQRLLTVGGDSRSGNNYNTAGRLALGGRGLSTKSVDSTTARATSSKPTALKHLFVKPFIFWALWMIAGTAFFRMSNGYSIGRSFFMAVNVGYCIGWDFPANASTLELYFSVAYMFIGASAVAVALANFAQSMIESSKEWYAQALEEQNYRRAMEANSAAAANNINSNRGSSNNESLLQRATARWQRLQHWCSANTAVVRVVCVWVLWLLLFLLLAQLLNPDWNFAQCLFFTFSSLVTSGLRDIPSSSPGWKFGIIAVLAATGVPITGVFMSYVANALIRGVSGEFNEIERKITARVTRRELEMMEHFNFEDGDGEISKAEYIVLCAVRLGALSPSLIEMIHKRFHQLDANNDGVLTYSEITETRSSRSSLIALRMIGAMKSGVRKKSIRAAALAAATATVDADDAGTSASTVTSVADATCRGSFMNSNGNNISRSVSAAEVISTKGGDIESSDMSSNSSPSPLSPSPTPNHPRQLLTERKAITNAIAAADVTTYQTNHTSDTAATVAIDLIAETLNSSSPEELSVDSATRSVK